jgi:hypothetical protein
MIFWLTYFQTRAFNPPLTPKIASPSIDWRTLGVRWSRSNLMLISSRFSLSLHLSSSSQTWILCGFVTLGTLCSLTDRGCLWSPNLWTTPRSLYHLLVELSWEEIALTLVVGLWRIRVGKDPAHCGLLNEKQDTFVVVAEARVKLCVLGVLLKSAWNCWLVHIWLYCVQIMWNQFISICHPFEWILSRASLKKESLITLSHLFNCLSNLSWAGSNLFSCKQNQLNQFAPVQLEFYTISKFLVKNFRCSLFTPF